MTFRKPVQKSTSGSKDSLQSISYLYSGLWADWSAEAWCHWLSINRTVLLLRVPNRVLQSHHSHPDRNFTSRRFLPPNPDPGHIFLSPYLNKNDPWSSVPLRKSISHLYGLLYLASFSILLFSVLPLLFDNACLPDHFDPCKKFLSEIIAIKEEH